MEVVKAVVLKVAMHCDRDGCVDMVRKGISDLTRLEVMEKVEAAAKEGEVKVVVTAGPEKLQRRLQKATGKQIDLIVLPKEAKNPITTDADAQQLWRYKYTCTTN